MEYKKNDLLTVTIEDMGHDGEGIGKVDGYTVFVKKTKKPYGGGAGGAAGKYRLRS